MVVNGGQHPPVSPAAATTQPPAQIRSTEQCDQPDDLLQEQQKGQSPRCPHPLLSRVGVGQLNAMSWLALCGRGAALAAAVLLRVLKCAIGWQRSGTTQCP